MEKTTTLFEISWEICNKVGGIHTVITSKTKQIKKHVNNYYQIGPYLENSKKEFKELKFPKKFEKQKNTLETLGIKIHYGESNQTKAKIFLIEYLNYSHNLNQIKKSLWEHYQIDSLNSSWYDFDEAILWSWVCGIVIEKLTTENKNKILVHAHEWMSGGTIFYLNLNADKTKFKTIFTTHATMLARSLSENNINLEETFDPNEEAYKLGVATKQQTEKALANNCDCFTTVSEITNQEASNFYSKCADVLLYNGFNNEHIENLDCLNTKYFKSRKKTNKLISKIFSKIPELNTDKVKLFYTSGRNEFKNKGFDIYIKALSKLNQTLIKEESDIKIINFFLVPIGDFEPLECEKCNEIPLKSHNIPNHPILDELKNSQLLNNPADKVFNILIPRYLDGNDKVINEKYYEFISGFELGVFPSYYEPWGYTPLESISYAVPTITSDLTGFGKHIEDIFGDFNPSVMILKRKKLSKERQIEKLYEMLYDQTTRNKKSQTLQREFAKLTALKFDWNKYIKNYIKAYEFALSKK